MIEVARRRGDPPANATDYGLAASVFSANGRRAIRAARDIRAGTVTVNCYGEGDISTPFGGMKQSGFGGRDNGVHAHDQFTEPRPSGSTFPIPPTETT